MTKQEAKELILREALTTQPDCVVIDDLTEIYSDFFVFFYQSKEYISSGKLEDMYVGNGPVIVCKNTRKVFETGSEKSSLEYIENFEACGDPNAELTDMVEVTGWQEGANKVQATKLIKRYGKLRLADAKFIVDSVMDDNSNTFRVVDALEIDEAVAGLINSGFPSKRIWSNQG